MKNFLQILPLLFFSFSSSFSQTTLIKDIASGNKSGLGSIFEYGFLPADQAVYFKATSDGFDNFVWKSDGSANGTKQAVSFSKIKYVDEMYFTKNGIFISDFNNGRKLLVSKGSDATTNTLSFFNDKVTSEPYTIGNKTIFVGSNSKDIFITDGTDAGSGLLMSLDKVYYNLEVTTNDSLALIFSSASTPDFQPFLYQSNADKIIDLNDYIKPYKTFDKIREAYIYKDIIMLNVIEDGFIAYYAFSLSSKSIRKFDYISELISGYEMTDGNYLILSKNGLFNINPSTLAFEELHSSIYFFTPSFFRNDKLYFYGSSFADGSNFYVSDGTKNGTVPLLNTKIGTDFYDSKCIEYNNDFYYLSSDANFFNPEYHLMKYDLNTKAIDTVAQVLEPFDGPAFDLGLFEVNGKLMVTKATEAKGHELYTVDVNTNTLDLVSEDKAFSIYPTISKDNLSVTNKSISADIFILDVNGNKLKTIESNQTELQKIDIAGLNAGIYFLSSFDLQGKPSVKKFIKI